MTAAAALRALEGARTERGPAAAARRLEAMDVLAGARLATAKQVERLHEALCFLRAYPDDAAVLARAAALLARFARRPDLRRHRAALEDSGIAGTRTRFPFFAGTARWLAARWGDRLHVDWRTLRGAPTLSSDSSRSSRSGPRRPALDELDLGARGWVNRLKGPRETDAAFLVRRLARLGRGTFEREAAWEALALPLVLDAGNGTPARTNACVRHGARRLPDAAARPRTARRPPRDRAAAALRRGRRAPRGRRATSTSRRRRWSRGSGTSTRSSGATRDDVRLVTFPDGLAFVAIGVVPERRLLLESVYGFLTLKNGVPIGYVLTSALFSSSEIAYNVFETFRGGESGLVYGKVLSMTRALFGSDAFTIFPYQLGGYGNAEALESGAWWFYRKLGFGPRAPRAVALMREEERRMAADPEHRTSVADLRIARLGERLLVRRAGRGTTRSASSSSRTSASG